MGGKACYTRNMDSQKLLDYLFRAKADLTRSLNALKGISSDNSDTMHAVCETEKWLQGARENVLEAIEQMSEYNQPDLMDDLEVFFNKSDESEADNAYGFENAEMWLHFSKACEIALHLGKISTGILVNRLDISPSQADFLISKLVQEEIIPNTKNESGEYIIF